MIPERDGATNIHAEGDGAFERAKRMLEAAEIDPELVEEIQVMVVHNDQNKTEDDDQEEESVEDVEESLTSKLDKRDMTISDIFGQKHTDDHGQRKHQVLAGLLEIDGWVTSADIIYEFGLDPDQGQNGTAELLRSAMSSLYGQGAVLNGTDYDQPVKRNEDSMPYKYKLKDHAIADAKAEVEYVLF